MGHRCEMVDRIDVCGNSITRIINATYKNKCYDVLIEDFDTGIQKCRYLYFTQLAGYTCVFPGEKLGYYYGYGIQEEEKTFSETTQKLNVGIDHSIMRHCDFIEIAKARPKYKYILKKIEALIDSQNFILWEQVFKILKIYDEHPEVEYLVNKDLLYLAKYLVIYRLAPENKKRFIKYLMAYREEIGKHDYKIHYLIQGSKDNIPPQYLNVVQLFQTKDTNKILKYIKKTPDFDVELYYDYVYMLKKVGHDLSDPYWEFPRSLKEAHDKVSAEVKQMELNKEMVKQTNLAKSVKRFQKYNTEIDSYKVFIPNLVQQFMKASDVLNQCLMTANYIDRVIKQESIIIMIWDKKENPIATAEINFKKEVKQFYGDEHDRNNCRPNDEIRNVLNKFLDGKKFRKYKELQTVL